jgi:hypothetical protein
LSTDATAGVSAIATWISDELRPTWRRLVLAQDLAASSPGAGLVRFDESLVSKASEAQVKQRVREATKLLKSGDPKSLAELTKLLQDNGLDPYFASAFAKKTSPEDYEQYIKAIADFGKGDTAMSLKTMDTPTKSCRPLSGITSRHCKMLSETATSPRGKEHRGQESNMRTSISGTRKAALRRQKSGRRSKT